MIDILLLERRRKEEGIRERKLDENNKESGKRKSDELSSMTATAALRQHWSYRQKWSEGKGPTHGSS